MSDLEQEVSAQRRGQYKLRADLEEWLRWSDIQGRMYDRVKQQERADTRNTLAEYFGGKDKIPNLRREELERILNRDGRGSPLGDNLKALLFYAIILSGVLLIFGGICYMMFLVSGYPGW